MTRAYLASRLLTAGSRQRRAGQAAAIAGALLAAAVIALLAAGLPASAQEPFIAVACTDFETGKLSVLESAAPWTPTIDVATIYSDAVLADRDGLLYVINRLGADNILVLDPADDYSPVAEYSVGGGSNPQGMAFNRAGNKGYISRQNLDDVLIVEPLTGASLGHIDLSAWEDADGYADLGDLIAIGDLLYVAILRLDRDFNWLPVGDSYIAVIDMRSDTLVDVDPGAPGVQAIALAGTDPAWELHYGPDDLLYASCVGTYGLQDGGLERIDPVAMTSLGWAVRETALGGDVMDAEIVSAHRGYAIVSDANFVTHLKRFDPATGGGVSTIAPGTGYFFSDIEVDASGDLYLCDATTGAAGVRVYNAATGALLSPAISVGLPPFDLLVPGREEVAVPVPPAFAQAALEAWPNPCNPRALIRWRGLAPGSAQLELFDASGRRAARLFAGLQEGEGTAVWSGIDAQGRPAPSGIYLARIETAGGQAASCRIALVR